ncbi:MAG: antitoxin Xre/MbcA/ParS toxin-binding domain-containing protein [Ignavibacteria bacterium]
MIKEDIHHEKLEKALYLLFSKFNKKGARFNVAEFLSNRLLLIEVIERGIPYSIFNRILEAGPFTNVFWSDALDLSMKSLQRYSASERRFDPIHSEKILELAEVIVYGRTVFDTYEKFKLWLETPNFALGNSRPMDLLKSSYGKELVLTELGRIEHGILA